MGEKGQKKAVFFKAGANKLTHREEIFSPDTAMCHSLSCYKQLLQSAYPSHFINLDTNTRDVQKRTTLGDVCAVC